MKVNKIILTLITLIFFLIPSLYAACCSGCCTDSTKLCACLDQPMNFGVLGATNNGNVSLEINKKSGKLVKLNGFTSIRPELDARASITAYGATPGKKYAMTINSESISLYDSKGNLIPNFNVDKWEITPKNCRANSEGVCNFELSATLSGNVSSLSDQIPYSGNVSVSIDEV